ncbi:HIRAN domain-containing protein [Dankookia sp. P2]|uniref:HIRAN domain-containing protein n=1 Tax=Dankookia sp. P2 TaxID=3423955 RepID=UPI003D67F4A8
MTRWFGIWEAEMDRWIKHFVEPPKLILSWQSPPGIADRARWAVGEVVRGEEVTFRYFRGQELAAANGGRTEERLCDAGFAGYPAFRWTRFKAGHVFRDQVLEAFLRRVPSRRREDFGRYLERFRLHRLSSFSPFGLLAATGAELPNDGFCLVDPLDVQTAVQDVVLEIMGHHYYALEGRRLNVGAAVNLVPEPTLERDPNAVRVEQDGELLGYVNRLQAKAVSAWLADRSIYAWGARVNGSKDRPRAFMFVEVRAHALAPAA